MGYGLSKVWFTRGTTVTHPTTCFFSYTCGINILVRCEPEARGMALVMVMPRPQRSINKRAISCSHPRFPKSRNSAHFLSLSERHYPVGSDLKTPIVVCNEADFRSRLYG